MKATLSQIKSSELRNRLFLWLLAILLVWFAFSQKQTKRFESLLVKDGLVQSAVLDIVSDEYGYLWFGTYGGLSRYDGSEFVNYTYNPNDSTSLSNNTVWSMKSTGDGNFWAGTSDGLSRFDWSKEHFIRYNHPDLTGQNIISIEQWSTDTLMIGTTREIFFFDIRNEAFFKMAPFDSFEGSVWLLQKSNQGSVLVYVNGVLHVINKDQTYTRKIVGLRALRMDRNSNIWALTTASFQLISPDLSQTRIIDKAPEPSIRAKISEHPNGNIFVVSNQIQVFDPDGNLLESHRSDPDRELSLLDVNLSRTFIGQDGIWWIGTGGYGVNKYDPNKPSIGLLGRKPGYSPSLSNSYVTSLLTQDDRILLVGTAQGLDIFDIEQSSIKNIYQERIQTLAIANGSYWAATTNTLLQIDIADGRVVQEIPVPGMYAARTIKGFEDGILWAGTGSGLKKIDLNTGFSKTIYPPSDHEKALNTGDWITSIQESKDKILIGTTAGLYSLDLVNEKMVNLGNPVLDPLRRSFIKCITMDTNGIIWIGTSGEGLFRWDIDNNALDQYTEEDGLPNNVIYGILEDENGFLWMSTNAGLSRLDDETKRFVNLDISYGLQSNEFNTGAYHKSPQGVFYFGGVKGLNYFNPGVVENPVKPETHITGIYLRNQRKTPIELEIDSGAIMDADTIVLSHTQNMLGLDFKSSNFTIPESNQYAYYLENLEEDWNYVGNRRYANYASLPPGEYIFKVKSSNNNGLWDTSPAELVIIIEAPFWQKAWFKVLVVVSALLLILSIVSLRIRNLKRNELRLKTLVEDRTKNLQIANSNLQKTIREKEETQQQLIQSEKMAALGVLSAGVGHEINNPLNFIDQALVSLENEIDEKGSGDPSKLTKLISIMHEGVSRASQIVKSLSTFSRSTISFDEECHIETIIDNCLVLLNNKLKDSAIIKKEYSANDAIVKGNGGKLHQVFFNLISNAEQAISNQGTITITTQIENGLLIISVSDTGDGIDSKNIDKIFDPFFTTKDPGKGTGLGLAITQTIIDEHKGKISVKSEPDKGTTFIITLPIV